MIGDRIDVSGRRRPRSEAARDVAASPSSIGGMIGEQGPPARTLAVPASPRLKLFLRRYQGDYLAA